MRGGSLGLGLRLLARCYHLGLGATELENGQRILYSLYESDARLHQGVSGVGEV